MYELKFDLQIDKSQAETAVRSAIRDLQGVADAARKGTVAHQQLGDVGARGLGAITAGAALAAVEMGALLQVVRDMGRAIRDAEESSRKLGKDFADQRDRLGELAAIHGKSLDNKFTLDFARYQQRASFRPTR